MQEILGEKRQYFRYAYEIIETQKFELSFESVQSNVWTQFMHRLIESILWR